MRFLITCVALGLLLSACENTPFQSVYPEDERYQASCRAPGLFDIMSLRMKATYCTKGYTPPR